MKVETQRYQFLQMPYIRCKLHHMLPLKPGCEKKCPACRHRQWSINESLDQKAAWLRQRMPEFQDRLMPIRGNDEESRWHYRSKVCLAAAWEQGKWKIGTRQREEVIAIHNCPVHQPGVNANVQLLCQSMPSFQDFPLVYFLQSGRQMTLVVKSNRLPDLQWIDANLIEVLKDNGAETLWIHLHPSAGRKVLGKGGWQRVFGPPHSLSEQGLAYGPASFTQVIPRLHEQTIAETLAFLTPSAKSFVVDLYSGIGATLIEWSKAGAHSVGIELDGEAVDCARINVPDVPILRGACHHRIPQLNDILARIGDSEILLYVNPPRTGLDEKVANWIAGTLKPARMAYLSCSAGTLHRDILYLTRKGFAVTKIIPFDFFPNTIHVETLALLIGPLAASTCKRGSG